MIERALVDWNRIKIVSLLREIGAGDIFMIVDVTLVVGRQDEFISYFIYLSAGCNVWLCCSLVVEYHVGLSVAGEVILSGTREIHSHKRLVDAAACLPAHEVVEAETLLHEFDSALAAYFEDYALVAAGDVGIACFLRIELSVRMGVGICQVEVGHSDTLANQVDGVVEVILRQCT